MLRGLRDGDDDDGDDDDYIIITIIIYVYMHIYREREIVLSNSSFASHLQTSPEMLPWILGFPSHV